MNLPRRTLLLAALVSLPVLTACQPRDATASGSAHSGAVRPVPAVVGQRLSDAIPTLVKAGFKRVVPSDGSAAHRVVLNPEHWVVRSQTPAAGTKADIGTKISLTVLKPSDGAGSGATATGVMPNVVCKDLQAARDTLEAAGFPLIASTDGTGKGRTQIIAANWVVIAQSAAPGTRPNQGEHIVLTVVKFGEPTGTSGCKS